MLIGDKLSKLISNLNPRAFIMCCREPLIPERHCETGNKGREESRMKGKRKSDALITLIFANKSNE